MKPSIPGILAALLAVAWCHRAAADVLDEIPADAAIIFKVRKLDQSFAKLAKFCAAAGIDRPEMKDPLASVEKSADLTKGIDNSGDFAFAFFQPMDFATLDDHLLSLIPVSDYKAFLSNFSNVKDLGGGIASATDPATNEPAFLAHWGNYAAMAKSKDFVSKKPGGLKLQGGAADEFAKRDFAVYIPMDPWRSAAEAKLKGNPEEIADKAMRQIQVPDAYKPLLLVWEAAWVDYARRFIEDTNASTVGLDVSETGALLAVVADFKPGSKLAAFADSLTSPTPPALAGLPDEPYALIGSASFSPQMKQQIIATLIDPLSKHPGTNDPSSKSIGQMIDNLRGIFTSTDGVAGGLIPTPGKIGDKSPYRIVRLATGDSPAIKKSYVDGWHALADYLQPPGPMTQPGRMLTVFRPDQATVDDVHFDLFSLDLGAFDPNRFQYNSVDSLVAKYTFGGWIGNVSPRSTLIVTGINSTDPLLHDSITAAKSGKDAPSHSKPFAAGAAHLPPSRPWEMFAYAERLSDIGIDQFAPDSAEQPVAISFAGAGDCLRVDVFVPATEVKFMSPFGVGDVTTSMPDTAPGN